MKKHFAIAFLCLAAVPSFAQKGNIGFVYPTGAQRGTSVEITIGGQNITKATGLTISGNGIKAELLKPVGKPQKRKNKDIGEEDNLQLADQVRFRLTIDRKAAPGTRDLRLILPNGVTNRLYFEVGQLPDICENPTEKLSASAGSLPVTFNGQIMRSDVDRFSFPAVKGQKLVLQTKARLFVPYMADAVPGWFQPIIRLYGPDGKEVAYNDDYLYHVDPVILYEVEESGNYEVEINDALYRGREDFVYRIDVGELPFLTGIEPLGGCVGSKKTSIQLRGWNLKSQTVKIKADKEGLVEVRGRSKSGIRSNALLFSLSSDSRVDSDTNGRHSERDSALALTLNSFCEQVFSEPMQQHWYSFSLSNPELIHINVLARHLGAPTDARITLFDSQGKTVADVDDFPNEDECMTTHFADPQLTKKLSAGRYWLRVIESQGKAGVDYRYIVSVKKSFPDFSLHIEPATFTVPAGGTGVFNVLVDRKQKFIDEINIKVSGLPEGFTASNASIPKWQKRTFVSVTAPDNAAQGVVFPVVQGSGKRDGVAINRTAVPVEKMMQAFYYTHLMPMDEFRMEVGETLPFKLSVPLSQTPFRLGRPGEEVPLKVHIDRKPGFTSSITLMMRSSLHGIVAEAVVVPEGADEAVLIIKTAWKKAQNMDKKTMISVYGVLKGSSKKVTGKSRNAYSAAATAYAPVFEAVVPK